MNILRTLLLIEDDPLDADLTIREFREIPLANEIVHYETADEALTYLQKNSEKIGVVLLDLHLPGMGGIDFLREVKQDTALRKIPVVVLSSSQEGPDVDICYELGVNAYVSKPVNRKAFREAIRSLGFFWAFVNHIPGR